jgi:hypothetical protein
MPKDTSILDKVTAKKRFTLPTGQSGIALLTLNSKGFLDSFDEAVLLDRYSPVVQKRIGATYQNNVKISGIFRTNYEHKDDNPWGGYSFIQVRKNSTGKASAYSGYGIAWRTSVPSKDSFIDISSVRDDGEGYWTITCDDPDTDTDDTLYLVQSGTDGKSYYIPFQHGGYNGGTLTECYLSNVTPSDSDQIALMSPNVYIVDNDPVHGDNYASKYVVDPLTGLSFIQAGVHLIESGKNYEFEITISSDNSLIFSLKEAGASGEPVDVLTTGANVPLSEYLGSLNMDSFGISVYDTNGYQWWYDDLKIEKLANEYAAMFFKMDTSGMPDMLQAQITAEGTSGFNLDIWNGSTPAWDNIISYGTERLATVLSKSFSKDSYSEDGLVTMRATSIAESDVGAPAEINVDSIKIIRSIAPGVHVGGCVDVYIDDPDAQVTDEDVTLSDAMGDVSNYPNIVNVTAGPAALVYGVDYVIVSGDPSTYNSMRSQSMIRVTQDHASATLTVSYWDSPVLTSIGEELDSSDHKPVATDVLIKHKVIHEVRTTEGVSSLEAYIGQLQYENGVKTISYSDFIKYVYSLSGTYISPRITIHAFDGKQRRMATLFAMGQEYAISDIETFRVVA